MEEKKKDLAYITLWVNDVWVTSKNATSYLRRLQKGIERQGGGCVVLHERVFSNPNNVNKEHVDKAWIPEILDDFIIWGKEQGYQFICY